MLQDPAGHGVPGFTCDGNASTPDIVVPPGNWYVDCPGGLKVAGLVAFRGGHVVTTGPVELGSNSACLAVNVPVDVPRRPAPPRHHRDPDTTTPRPDRGRGPVHPHRPAVQGGPGAALPPATFTYLEDGYTDLAGGSGALLMTTPLAAATACATSDVCKNQHFRGWCFGARARRQHDIGGRAPLSCAGVLFTPNAPSTFTGQAGQQQADAQFWTRTLEVKGQGTLVMAADPDASVARPLLGVSLIR